MRLRIRLLIIVVSVLGISISLVGQNKPSQENTAAKASQPVPSLDFIDGKTIINEIVFTGLDSDDAYLNDFVRSAPLSDLIGELRENRCLIEANDKFDSRKLEQTIKVASKFLFGLGFLDAKVVALGERLPKGRMKLVISVEKGIPVGISRFVFTGTKYFNSDELVGALISCLRDDWRVADWRKINYCTDGRVRRFMWSKGYLKAKINHVGRRFVNKDLEIVVDVSEGTVHRFGDITVEGAKVFSSKEILEMFGKKPGDIVNGEELQDFAYDKLKNLYLDRGYVEFNDEFEPVFIDPIDKDADPTVNITFILDEGPRFKLARLEFSGVAPEESRDLNESFPLKVGDFFSKSKLTNWCNSINETEKYNNVNEDRDVELLVSDTQASIDLIIKLSKRE